jgi:hypothetical protein
MCAPNDIVVSVCRTSETVQGKRSRTFPPNPEDRPGLRLCTNFACPLTEGTNMMLLTGLAVWMVAAMILGLMFGRAMQGYAVKYEPVPVPVRTAARPSAYHQAA